MVGLNLDTEALDCINLCLDNVFWKTECRDTVHENASCFVERFKDSDRVSETGKLCGCGKTGRAGTDDCYLLSGRLCRNRALAFLLNICNEAFQVTDGNRVSFLA